MMDAMTDAWLSPKHAYLLINNHDCTDDGVEEAEFPVEEALQDAQTEVRTT
jgi:hypothetical protein